MAEEKDTVHYAHPSGGWGSVRGMALVTRKKSVRRSLTSAASGAADMGTAFTLINLATILALGLRCLAACMQHVRSASLMPSHICCCRLGHGRRGGRTRCEAGSRFSRTQEPYHLSLQMKPLMGLQTSPPEILLHLIPLHTKKVQLLNWAVILHCQSRLRSTQ